MKSENGGEKIFAGLKLIVLGICLYIFELLSLPVFGVLQKIQVSGQGFKTDFMKYASVQPYPLVFILTGIIVVVGIALIYWGHKEKNN